MDKKSYDAVNVNFGSLEMCTAKNNVLNFETGAIQATEKNFGHLAIVFTTEVLQNDPRMHIRLSRSNASCGEVLALIRPGDWLVMLWGEIHIFPDWLFRHTFTTDEYIEYRCSVCGKISGDNQSGTYNEMHRETEIHLTGLRLGENVTSSELQPCNMDLKV